MFYHNFKYKKKINHSKINGGQTLTAKRHPGNETRKGNFSDEAKKENYRAKAYAIKAFLQQKYFNNERGRKWRAEYAQRDAPSIKPVPQNSPSKEKRKKMLIM